MEIEASAGKGWGQKSRRKSWGEGMPGLNSTLKSGGGSLREVNLTLKLGVGKFREANFILKSARGNVPEVNSTLKSRVGRFREVNFILKSARGNLPAVNLTLKSGVGKFREANFILKSARGNVPEVDSTLKLGGGRLREVNFILKFGTATRRALIFRASPGLTGRGGTLTPCPAMNWDEGFWDEGTWDDPGPGTSVFLPEPKRKLNRRTMASNPTPDDNDLLQALAEDLADGNHLHEVAIPIKQNTEVVLRAANDALTAAQQAYAAARLVVNDRYTNLQTVDDAGKNVLKGCKLRFAKLYGSVYNAQWAATGWPTGSTSVPTLQDVRFNLLNSLKVWFTANPAAESDDMDATAAKCAAAHAAVSNARQAVNQAESAQATAKATAETASRTLRKRVRGVIEELGTVLADDDVRWSDYGLNVPANPVAPEPISAVTLTASGGGKVFAQWPYSTRMSSTRLMTLRVGTDDDFQNAGTVDGLERMLTGFTPGITLQVKAIAYNDGGDAPDSPVASVVVT